MHNVKSYVKENKKELQEIFDSMSSQSMMEATKVYLFLQSAFDTQEFKFLQNGKSYFSIDENSQKIQGLMEDYYLKNNQGETKFYMYRVEFSFDQIIDIIRHWLNKDKSISVYYNNESQVQKQPSQKDALVKNNNNTPTLQKVGQQKQDQQNQKIESKQQEDNEFMPELKDIPEIIKKYREEISKYETRINNGKLNQEEIKTTSQKIKQLQTKIIFLEERLKKAQKSPNKNKLQQKISRNKSLYSENSQTFSPQLSKRAQKQISPSKIQSTLKSIFQFYAKQLHVTGVKASFQRIEHQSNRLNYQKLVHFLKQYQIFPESTKDQKKIHPLYVKFSSKTRDLTYQGFLNLLEKLADIIIPAQTQINIPSYEKNRFQLLKYRIIEKRRKNKTLNNPFHSLQKEDFRIDKATLKYEFKLMPLNGKDPEQITTQLQNRRLIKKQRKNQREHLQMKKKIRYIKKLQSIDPFHPLVEKNKHLIKQKSLMESEPVVSMQNMEMFRDKSFDLRMLGIDEDDQQSGRKAVNSTLGRSIASNNSYIIRNRAQEVQKIEVDKMRNLMSGIIERSNAKLQKLGLSPSKRLAKNNIY